MMFTARSPSLFENDPRWKPLNLPRRSVGPRTGVLPSQALHALIERKEIYVSDGAIDPGQVQPASLDLRLGAIAYRIRASFLPGKGGTVEASSRQCSRTSSISARAQSWRRSVYLVPLMERLDLCAPRSPRQPTRKSSTGRLDVFTG
jgi:dCTP deaminase